MSEFFKGFLSREIVSLTVMLAVCWRGSCSGARRSG